MMSLQSQTFWRRDKAHLDAELGEPSEEVIPEGHLLLPMLGLKSLDFETQAVNLALEALDFDFGCSHRCDKGKTGRR